MPNNKAVFLDRDDTIVEDPGYINHPDQVKLLSGVAKPLSELKAMGYKLVVVSNQSGVARGIVTEKILGEVHNRLKQLLAESGVYLDGIYYCPYHPDGIVPKYRKESDWRKPSPGMLLTAAEQMDIDLSRSWMIGNSGRDIEAGLRGGCKTILIEQPGRYKPLEPGQSPPNNRAVNMKEAVNIIKKYERSPRELTAQPQSAPLAQPEAELQDNEKPNQLKETETSKGVFSESDISSESNISGEGAQQLLCSILEQLRRMQRDDMFGEFSITRLLAGVVQIIVLGCLLISIWFLLRPVRGEDSIMISLGFAMVFQVMALSLYIMQGRK